MSERTENKARIIAVSGPDGAGKGYLMSHALEQLGLTEVPMVTTREHRGASETKVPLSREDYDALLNAGELIGHHINNGHFYAFRASDFENLTGAALVELNAHTQAKFPEELKDKGIEMVGWVGLHGEPAYLRQNIEDRAKKDGKEIPADVIDGKMDMANQIMEALRDRADEGVVTMFKVGWDNRATMHTEFTQLVDSMLQDKQNEVGQ